MYIQRLGTILSIYLRTTVSNYLQYLSTKISIISSVFLQLTVQYLRTFEGTK